MTIFKNVPFLSYFRQTLLHLHHSNFIIFFLYPALICTCKQHSVRMHSKIPLSIFVPFALYNRSCQFNRNAGSNNQKHNDEPSPNKNIHTIHTAYRFRPCVCAYVVVTDCVRGELATVMQNKWDKNRTWNFENMRIGRFSAINDGQIQKPDE